MDNIQNYCYRPERMIDFGELERIKGKGAVAHFKAIWSLVEETELIPEECLSDSRNSWFKNEDFPNVG
jgi:hypothetical protein